MRRNRGAMINIVLFLLALSLILYLNSPAGSSSAPKNFAWTQIRYKTRARDLPPSRGVCPGLSDGISKPALIVARTVSESPSWLDKLSTDYHICSYTADADANPKSNHLQTPANRGHESMAYLTFIIDNYDYLPSTGMVFVHGSRFAWHNDDPMYDNVSLLKQLDVKRALWGPPGPATGYWNMKCDWSAGMCDAKDPDAKPQGSLETRTRAILERGNRRVLSDVALADALAVIFGSNGPGFDRTVLSTSLGRGDAVRSQCCAQFIVARENIWSHTREEYVALRQWLLDGSDKSHGRRGHETDKSHGDAGNYGHSRIKGGQTNGNIFDMPAPADDYIAGRVLSYVWHILFLPSYMRQPDRSAAAEDPLSDNADAGVGVDLTRLNELACPSAEECYCRLYGRCNLVGCTKPGRCQGQYHIPLGYTLPADWAQKHS